MPIKFSLYKILILLRITHNIKIYFSRISILRSIFTICTQITFLKIFNLQHMSLLYPYPYHLNLYNQQFRLLFFPKFHMYQQFNLIQQALRKHQPNFLYTKNYKLTFVTGLSQKLNKQSIEKTLLSPPLLISLTFQKSVFFKGVKLYSY